MTIYGWDMSHYDGVSIGNAVSEGIQFITHKAGGDANDAELAAWWDGVRDYRMKGGNVLLGAYWVLYPGNPVGRADAFLARLDSQCPSWRAHPFILQIDAEIWGGRSDSKPSVAECNAFADRLRNRCPKLMPIGYLPKWVYGDAVRSFRYPLWASAYVNGSGGFKTLYPGDGSSRWNAYGGKVPDILQYTSSATIGGQTTCDANAYRGTLKELTALLAPGWVEEEIEDMALDASDKAWIAAQLDTIPKDVWSYPLDIDVTSAGTNNQPAGGILRYVSSEHRRLDEKLSALLAAAGQDNVDEAAIVAGVLAGLNPEAIAAAIPADIAQNVVDLLSARLAE